MPHFDLVYLRSHFLFLSLSVCHFFLLEFQHFYFHICSLYRQDVVSGLPLGGYSKTLNRQHMWTSVEETSDYVGRLTPAPSLISDIYTAVSLSVVALSWLLEPPLETIKERRKGHSIKYGFYNVAPTSADCRFLRWCQSGMCSVQVITVNSNQEEV